MPLLLQGLVWHGFNDIWQNWPVYPIGHAHVYELTPFIHVALLAHELFTQLSIWVLQFGSVKPAGQQQPLLKQVPPL